MSKHVGIDLVIYHICKYIKERPEANGKVPFAYKVDGIHIGAISQQIRTGKRQLSEQNIKKLEECGFDFSVRKRVDISFDKLIELLEIYLVTYNNVDVPQSYTYTDFDGNVWPLGHYIMTIRNKTRFLSQEEIEKLNALGFNWQLRYTSPYKPVKDCVTKYLLKIPNINGAKLLIGIGETESIAIKDLNKLTEFESKKGYEVLGDKFRLYGQKGALIEVYQFMNKKV